MKVILNQQKNPLLKKSREEKVEFERVVQNNIIPPEELEEFMSSKKLEDIINTSILVFKNPEQSQAMLTTHVVSQLRSALQAIFVVNSMRRCKELSTFSLEEYSCGEVKQDRNDPDKAR